MGAATISDDAGLAPSDQAICDRLRPTRVLKPTGAFKAAEARFTDVSQNDRDSHAAWLSDARKIQWDYKNIIKRKGRLERLV